MSSSGFGFPRERVTIDVGGGKLPKSIGIIGGAAFLLLIFAFMAVVQVPSGHVAVLTLFGKVQSDVLPEGLHIINPMKKATLMTVRTQEVKEAASVPSNEGLIMTLDTSLLFRVDPAHAADLYQKVGPQYISLVLEPNLRSAIRSITAAHSANALYSGEREKVAQQIFSELERAVKPRGVIVESVLLRDIQLPASLKTSIEEKQRAEQESLAMSFRLQKERQEAERKRIEAEGIRDFQRTVSQGISPELLTWKGIEATQLLANSPNSKVVVIGNTRNGLPIILGEGQR